MPPKRLEVVLFSLPNFSSVHSTDGAQTCFKMLNFRWSTNKLFLLGGLIFVLLSFCDRQVYGSQQHLHANDDSILSESRGQGEKKDETLLTTSSSADVWSMVANMNQNDHNDGHSGFGTGAESLTESNYDWHLKLDQKNRYCLDWTVYYSKNLVHFSVGINQTAANFRPGFDIFALGFSPNGELASSDFCIVWYDLGHRQHLQDASMHPDGRLELIDRTRSHCKLIKSSRREDVKEDEEDDLDTQVELEQFTRLVFKRPLEVCSQSQGAYYTIDNGTTHLVWFTIRGPLLSLDKLNITELSTTTNLDNSLGFDWGMKRVQLVAAPRKRKQKNLEGGQQHVHEIRMDKFAVPARETTYWCKLFKLPHRFESRRFHITSYEAVIDRPNEHVVHHMELFNCANLSPEQSRTLNKLHAAGGWAGECGSLAATNPCRRVILAWAMGAHPLEYPEQVGQSVGGPHYSPYVVLEVHYNNLGLARGLVDSSGLRFHYTSRLRLYDAGVLEVGLEYTDKNSVPPNMNTPLAGHCLGECTRAAMAASGHLKSMAAASSTSLDKEKAGKPTTLEEGIYIFAAQMHTHLAGVATWTEQVRGGQLVRELQRDDHYSTHFQEIRLLPELVHLRPGDSLIHYCVYDTRQRRNITLGGFATSDEMCVTYLHYYPRIDLEVCKSSVDTRSLEHYFRYMAREEAQGDPRWLRLENEPKPSVAESYHRIEWSARRSQELIEFYANAPLSVQCNRSNGERHLGYWQGLPATRLWDQMRGPQNPLRLRWPQASELVAYRGRGHRARHAQCLSDERVPPSDRRRDEPQLVFGSGGQRGLDS